MMLRKIIKNAHFLFLAAFVLMAAFPVQAEVSLEEAERLKKDLTPFGAERAGNAEGTIPAWKGGLTQTPEHVNYDPKMGYSFPDPFADDKILFTITAENMDQYADQLSTGLKAMFKKYPDTWKMNIYPTRRTAAAPKWVYEGTYKNALSAKTFDDPADGYEGACRGIPFPIPKNGAEAILNHISPWEGLGREIYLGYRLVYPNGSNTNTNASKSIYLNRHMTSEREDYDGKKPSILLMVYTSEPTRSKGEIVLSHNPTDYRGGRDRAVWMYMPGQRRVRRAPQFAYDTPAQFTGSLSVMDDAAMFNGRIDRFDWKLRGKKEMYIPYNNYKIDKVALDDLLTAHHPNPEHLRWELHRVLVNEATLAEGKRHCYGKRIFYQDEDTYIIHLKDNYDTRGTLWRTAIQSTKSHYTLPGVRTNPEFQFDLLSGTYVAGSLIQNQPASRETVVSESKFTPQTLRREGRR